MINRYQYNEKEKQPETSWLDYGARMYMLEIGRWGTVYPMAEDAYDWTPYRYGFNNPILYSDPDGLLETEEEVHRYAKDNNIRTGWFSENEISQQADGSYTINNKSAGTSIFNDNDHSVVTATLGTGIRENNGETQNASTMALPLPLSMPSLAGMSEKTAEVSLAGLRIAATIPLLTLALVLTPTQANAPALVFNHNPSIILSAKLTSERNPEDFKRLPGNQGGIRKQERYTKRPYFARKARQCWYPMKSLTKRAPPILVQTPKGQGKGKR